jgi:O-antigen/teichoic acid export membrane protein
MPARFRNYWAYSIGLAVAWGIVLAIVSATKRDKLNVFLLVFAWASIGWASGTIARYVYPPPRRWFQHP